MRRNFMPNIFYSVTPVKLKSKLKKYAKRKKKTVFIGELRLAFSLSSDRKKTL